MFAPPPTAEVAEMNRIHYELQYTEGINQRMQIPATLRVAPENHTESLPPQQPVNTHTTLMQVPERIVVAGHAEDPHFSHPHDLDLIQSIPPTDFTMKAPPHVLTLTQLLPDSLEPEQTAASQSPASSWTYSHSRSRRERSASDNVSARHSSQTSRGDVSVSPSPSATTLRPCPPLSHPEDANINLFTTAGLLSYIQSTTRRAYQQLLEALDDRQRRRHLDFSLDGNLDESGLVDASSLRRQIIKLNRRLQLLEEEYKERSKREVILYSATVAFWLINTWIWFRR